MALAVAHVVVAMAAGAPVLLAWMVLLRRRGGFRATGLLLGATVLTSVTLLGEVALLGSLPIERPLDWLPTAHGGACLAVMAWLWARRIEARRTAGRVLRSLRSYRRETPGLERAVVACAVAAQLSVTALGVWLPATETDELSYHLPQAVQIIQDARPGRVHEPVVWADSYPRGVPMLWSWAYLIARDEGVFHAMSGVFGLALMLAGATAGRRAGLTRASSALAGALVGATPVAWRLSCTGLIDLPTCALTAAGIAFALGPGAGRRADLALAVLACVAAVWMKFTAMAPAVVVIGLRVLAAAWHDRGGPRPTRRSTGPGVWMAARAGPRGALALALIGLALASAPYLRTWASYPTPVWPLRLSVGGWVLADGFLESTALGASNLGWAARYIHFWTAFQTPTTVESPGGLGAAFALLLLPASLVLAAGAGRGAWRDRSGTGSAAILAAVFVLALAAPGFHFPRYVAYLPLPGAVALGWLLDRMRADRSPAREAIVLVTGALLGVNAWFYAGAEMERVRELLGASGGFARAELTAARDAGVRLESDQPHPSTRAFVRAAARPGDLVMAVAVPGPTVLLHGPGYRYRVEWDPGLRGEAGRRYAGNRGVSEIGASLDGDAWAGEIERRGPRIVLAYAGSDEAAALTRTGRFAEVFRQDRAFGPRVVVVLAHTP
ncbi:MAG: hypothetical protein JNM07_04345 [Phycisphaerae bacterium]|nr:hypothetical protein [Phycisphaerae bacterium]